MHAIYAHAINSTQIKISCLNLESCRLIKLDVAGVPVSASHQKAEPAEPGNTGSPAYEFTLGGAWVW